MGKKRFTQLHNPAKTKANTNEHEPTLVQQGNFYRYLFSNKENKRLLLLIVIVNICLFSLYKYCFPQPDFFGDSHGYILAAAKKMELYYRPAGYSRFLIFLHDFSDSANFVVWVQYVFLILSGIFALFSVDYLFGFKIKWIKVLALCLITINPLLMALANQIASDSLFTFLTVTWFTLLLWIFKKRSWGLLVLQLIILYCAFRTRYNALYFPLIAVGVFLFRAKKKTIAYSVCGIGATLLVIALAYNQIKKTTERVTAAPVFAGFSGWQLANNALIAYAHLDSIPTSNFDDRDLKILNLFVQRYIDSVDPKVLEQIKANKYCGAIFLWDKNSPLKRYLYYYCNKYRTPYFRAWYQVSSTYGKFGRHIILHHPFAFTKYYLLNNLKLLFLPSEETLAKYSPGKMPPVTKFWFNIKSDYLVARYPKVQKTIIGLYPYFNCFLICLTFLVTLLYLFENRKDKGVWRENTLHPVLFWLLFFLTGAAFSVLASVIVLRYQVLWFILYFTLPFWFLDQIIFYYRNKKPEKSARNTHPKLNH